MTLFSNLFLFRSRNDAVLPKPFMALCKLYEGSIVRDPDFHKYLETIGHNYFGLPKPQKSNDDNPLASLMKSLLGDSPGGSGAGPSGPGGLFQQILAPRPSGSAPPRTVGQPSGAPQSRPQPIDDDDLD